MNFQVLVPFNNVKFEIIAFGVIAMPMDYGLLKDYYNSNLNKYNMIISENCKESMSGAHELS